MVLSSKILKHRVHSPLKSPRRSKTYLRRSLLKQLSGEVQFGAASKANVKVVVRVRPLNEREAENRERHVVKVVDERMLIFDPKPEEEDFFFKGIRQRTRDLNKRQPKEQKFMFERIFDVDSTNEQIYEETTKDLVDTILAGYNCSVFAYGATGAGKTFTMLGKLESPGITFLTLMELYRRIDEIKEEKTCEVGVSYLEVYNETVRDLLQPGKLLNVQENGLQVLVPGLSLHKPDNADKLLEMLAYGNQNRTQHPTDANAESSRSHAVFQIFVRQQPRISDLKSNVCIAKLSMIDLAGSERGAATGFKGARFREGASINKSLLALGNCINALADGLHHVPYRNSKLTRLLKDSIGGNCRSIMIAAVSPAVASYEDTFNTLRYANRAKTIKTTLKKNLMNVDQHVSQYVKIVEDLREEICRLKEKVKSYEEKEKSWASSQANFALANEALLKKDETDKNIASLKEELQKKSDVANQTYLSDIFVSEEESLVQKKIEFANIEQKVLRREFLQLESLQREKELEIYYCNLRLLRMHILSPISRKLDKSVSKCERTIRNLKNKLEQIGRYQQSVERKLQANLEKSQAIQMELSAFGPNNNQPSTASRALLEKNETVLAERDLLQLSEYLKGLVKHSINEQNSTEYLISQLLNVVQGFYVQLRANNICTPDMENLFENCIKSMDESKVLWADQKNADDSSVQNNKFKPNQPALDINRLTQLPILSNTFISPTVPQENKFTRRSIMKNTSCDNLQNSCLKKFALKQSPGCSDTLKNSLSQIPESSAEKENVMRIAVLPKSPVLSSYSSIPIPSPVIGSRSIPSKISVSKTLTQLPSSCTCNQVSGVSNRSRMNCESAQNHSVMGNGNSQISTFCHLTLHSGIHSTNAFGPTPSRGAGVNELLKPSVPSLPSDMPSSSQSADTPIDLSSKSSLCHSLVTTSYDEVLHKHEDGNSSLEDLNKTPHVLPLNTTVDLSEPGFSVQTIVPKCENSNNKVFVSGNSATTSCESLKKTSKRLCHPIGLDSTYILNMSLPLNTTVDLSEPSYSFDKKIVPKTEDKSSTVSASINSLVASERNS
ncbi:Kinesin-like protein kif18a [Halocaridina rubra]|uniref:Kinesin-like protein kif18a n=1 Tax=Halocaridina rubra TaxID=373956 RepID=A0AAN8XDJ5_HALRR